MLTGSTQILANIPGKHLSPLLLAQSQSADLIGYIMVAYEIRPQETGTTTSRFYDLLFLRGPHIYECARMNSDLRLPLKLDVALQTFKRSGIHDGTRIFLFASPDDTLQRFQSTLYFEPCLKVHIKGLSKRRLDIMLSGTGFQKGIVECNEFAHLLPTIDLKMIPSVDDLIQYRPPFRHGRILLYDVEKNKELIGERYFSKPMRSGQHFTRPPFDSERLSAIPEGLVIQRLHSSADRIAENASVIDEGEMEKFSQYIAQILDSAAPSKPDENQVHLDNPQPGHDGTFIITTRSDDANITYAGKLKQKQILRELPSMPRHSRRPPLVQPQPAHSPRSHPKPQTAQSGAGSAPEEELRQPSEFVRLFERLFRSFRTQVFEVYGDKCDAVIENATRRGRFLMPEFDLQHLNEESALMTLEMLEHISNDASFLKRSRLRQAALTLVADLYNKQYELLEKHHAIDKVEQFYYRLRR